MNGKRHISDWQRLCVSLLIAHLPLIPPVVGFLVLRGKTAADELHGFEILCAKVAPLWNVIFLIFYLPALGITNLIVRDPKSWTPSIIGCIIQSTIIGIGLWAWSRRKITANQASGIPRKLADPER